MRPKAEFVNVTINVLDRVHKEYLTVCQTEVTTKNIEFSFVINRLMVKYSNYGRGYEALIVELTTRPKAELLISIKAEAVGRSFNAWLTPQPSL